MAYAERFEEGIESDSKMLKKLKQERQVKV